MSTIRVTKEFTFEAAHALPGHDGPCRHVHGHSYKLSVTVAGSPGTVAGSPKLGMVIDFGDLKRIVKHEIIDRFDHALLLNEKAPQPQITNPGEVFGNVLLLPYQPTSENMLIDFASRIRGLLPAGTSLHSMRLRETGTCYAEWHSVDNPQ